jgi:hypothetical protein
MKLPAAVLSLAVLPLLAHADPVADLEVARAQANAHFKTAAARIPEVGKTLATASEAFRGCKNGALQFQFSGAIERLERSRRALEKGRKEAQAVRRSLEAVRAKLEAAHGRRKSSAHEEAVAGEQLYAERMLNEYVKPLDGTLVPLIDAYTAGVSGYSEVLTRYAEFCAKPGYTPSSGAAFVSSVDASVEALSAKADQLVASAGEAQKQVSERALSSAPGRAE